VIKTDYGVGPALIGQVEKKNAEYSYTVLSESLCALVKAVGSDVNERLYRPELV
jgi:hypothetical protein